MSVEIAWKQNFLVTDFHLLNSLLVVFGFGSQAFVCGFSRQNINSAHEILCDPKSNVFDRELANAVQGCFFHDKTLVKVITVRPRLVLQYCCG